MITIPLTQGKSTVIDDEDFDRVSRHRWWAVKMAAKGSPRFYAVTKLNGKRLTLHRLLLKTDSPHIDHIDGDSLNNRRSNLRGVTVSENIINAKIRSDNTSGYKNIYSRNGGKFDVEVRRNKIKHRLGRFNSIDDAVVARDNFIKSIGEKI